MLDRHAVQALLCAQLTARAIATQFGVSVRTVRRIAREEAVCVGADAVVRPRQAIGRPRVTEAVRERVRALVVEDPECPPSAICRLLRDDGMPFGLSTAYRVLAGVRTPIARSCFPRRVRRDGPSRISSRRWSQASSSSSATWRSINSSSHPSRPWRRHERLVR